MKNSLRVITFSAAMLAGTAAFAENGVFNPGGVTYDFAAISQQRFQPATTVGNLLAEWKSAPPWVHLRDGELARKIRLEVTPLIVFKKDGGTLSTMKPAKIEEIAGRNAENVSGSWLQNVKLPDTDGGRYHLQFKYNTRRNGKFSTAGYVIATSFAQKKSLGTTVKTFPTANGDGQLFSGDLQVPSGADKLELYLRLDGCGEIQFSDISLNKSPVTKPFTLLNAPGELLDRKFVLSQNDPAIMTFAWQRNTPVKNLQLKQPELVVELPPGVKLLSGAAPLGAFKHSGNRYVFALPHLISRAGRIEGYDAYLLLPLVLTTELAPGTIPGGGTAFLADNGQEISNRQNFTFSVIPTIPAVGKPNLYMSGFQPGGLYFSINDSQTSAKMAEFVGRTGMRWIGGALPKKDRTEYRKNGISMITPELYYVANGYRIGTMENKPEYAKFKTIGKTSDFNIINGTCPAAIYKKTGYFNDNIVPYLKRELAGTDGLISNWEPFMFHGMGCFCDVCRADFAEFANISAGECAKIWPHELLINRKYHASGIKFRSLQHAKMVKTIDETVKQITGGKAGFIPEIAWIHMIDYPGRYGDTGEHDPLDYADTFNYIDPWGPYITWKALEPYTYEKGANLNTFVAAQRIVDFTNKNFRPGKRPKLMALPHGMQCDFWVTQPESAAMEVLGFFVAGFDASHLYLFPKGYDNRFWAAQSAANNAIATHEKMVRQGKSIPCESAPVTPYPAEKKRLISKYFADAISAPLLQTSAFAKDGNVLLAAGNFWEKGDVFFLCRIPGLPAGQQFEVCDTLNHICYGKISGANLAKEGVMLHVGALRWAFFDIRPVAAADSAKCRAAHRVTQPEVKIAAGKRAKALQTPAAIEAARDQADDLLHRKSELKNMKSGNLVCRVAKDAANGQLLEFSSGKNSLRLGLKGFAVQSWKIGGKELLAGSDKSGMASPAFWLPPVQLEQAFVVTSQTIADGKITVTAERRLNKKDAVTLACAIVRQSYTFSADLTQVDVKTQVINAADDESGRGSLTCGFRYHIMPLCLGTGGSIDIGGRIFQRQQERMIFGVDRQSAAAMKKLFEAPGAVVAISGDSCVWNGANAAYKIKMQLAPAKLFAGFACWDTPNLQAPTFEPFFSPVVIKADESVEFQMTLRAEPLK